MSLPAVIFDAFGTLLHIPHPRHPYRRLLKLGQAQGRTPRAEDTRWLMQTPLSLEDAASALGIALSDVQLADLQQSLNAELACAEAYADGLQAVATLQAQGIRVAVCSNLASPYRSAVQRLYPTLDVYAFSCELGMMKPDEAIYRTTCERLLSPAEATWMVGDSRRCDREGPQAFGVQGRFLDRHKGRGDYSELLGFAEDVLNTLHDGPATPA
mgnify:FL=1